MLKAGERLDGVCQGIEPGSRGQAFRQRLGEDRVEDGDVRQQVLAVERYLLPGRGVLDYCPQGDLGAGARGGRYRDVVLEWLGYEVGALPVLHKVAADPQEDVGSLCCVDDTAATDRDE